MSTTSHHSHSSDGSPCNSTDKAFDALIHATESSIVDEQPVASIKPRIKKSRAEKELEANRVKRKYTKTIKVHAQQQLSENTATVIQHQTTNTSTAFIQRPTVNTSPSLNQQPPAINPPPAFIQHQAPPFIQQQAPPFIQQQASRTSPPFTYANTPFNKLPMNMCPQESDFPFGYMRVNPNTYTHMPMMTPSSSMADLTLSDHSDTHANAPALYGHPLTLPHQIIREDKRLDRLKRNRVAAKDCRTKKKACKLL